MQDVGARQLFRRSVEAEWGEPLRYIEGLKLTFIGQGNSKGEIMSDTTKQLPADDTPAIDAGQEPEQLESGEDLAAKALQAANLRTGRNERR